MILQQLHAYYLRLREDPDSGVAPPGFSPQPISFAIILDREGKLLQIQDIRDVSGRKPRAISMLVPEAAIRSVNIASNFLWDNSGYVLGEDGKGRPDRAAQTFEAFRELHHAIGDGVKDEGMRAVLAFLDSWHPPDAAALPSWDEIAGANLVFRLEGEHQYLHERPAVIASWIASRGAVNTTTPEQLVPESSMCLVTGETRPITKLHNKIKGVKDAQSMGASVVSFNLDSFCSYGKTQNYNAPVSEEAAFGYTTALNHLLRFESRQKVQISDATTVFWGERPTPVESIFGIILDPRESSLADGSHVAKLKTYLEAVGKGRVPDQIDESVRFFILGLSPNVSRLSVRFWYPGTVGDLNRALCRHFEDLRIVRDFDNQLEYPGLWQLMIETAPLRKSENINPNLAGAMMRSILTGIAYPSFLLATIVNRIRADQQIGYYRAALVKAVLCRNARIQSKPMEVTEVLNESSMNPAYRLGRLFAVLEKAQQEAVPTAKATIKDRFYGSASSTPSVVFPQLLRLNQHHLAKLDVGGKVRKERQIQDISDGIERFPSHLSLNDQGLFALGYYHQRKALFTKRDSVDGGTIA